MLPIRLEQLNHNPDRKLLLAATVRSHPMNKMLFALHSGQKANPRSIPQTAVQEIGSLLKRVKITQLISNALNIPDSKPDDYLEHLGYMICGLRVA